MHRSEQKVRPMCGSGIWSFLWNSNLLSSQVKLIEYRPQFFCKIFKIGRENYIGVFPFFGITIFHRQNKMHVMLLSVFIVRKKKYHCMFIIWKSWNKTTCTATVTTTVAASIWRVGLYTNVISAEYFGIIYSKSPIQKNYIAFKQIFAHSF